MANPTRLVPDAQTTAFGLAVCERLGLDPAVVSDQFAWEVVSGDEFGTVTFTAHLPSDEILAMFNGAAPAVTPS